MYRSLVYKCGPFQAGLGTTTKQGINAVCRHTAIPIPHWKYYLCLLLNWLIWIHYKLQFLSVLNPSLVPCPPQNFSYTHTLRGREIHEIWFTVTQFIFDTVKPFPLIQKHQQKQWVRSLLATEEHWHTQYSNQWKLRTLPEPHM